MTEYATHWEFMQNYAKKLSSGHRYIDSAMMAVFHFNAEGRHCRIGKIRMKGKA